MVSMLASGSGVPIRPACGVVACWLLLAFPRSLPLLESHREPARPLLLLYFCCRDLSSPTNPLSPAVEQVRRRIRRRRRSCADPRNLLILFTLISCLGTVLFVYSRTAAGLP